MTLCPIFGVQILNNRRNIMNRDNNLQGGDHILPLGIYKECFNYVNDGDSICNIGSGITFKFEQELLKVKKVKISCIDIIPLNEKPKFIEKYINKEVEKLFYFKNKFDLIFFFELIEHIDKTDILFRNIYNNLKDNSLMIFSFPNLSSIYVRLELLLGFQPHILEISNISGVFGTGIFGKFNNPKKKSIHHIRGITNRGMKELVRYNGFKIEKIVGWEYRLPFLFKKIPCIAPINIFICRKISNFKYNNL